MPATIYDLKPGDHIYVPRRDFAVRYTHHGLYLGDGQVIQYSGHSSDDAMGRIDIVSLDAFRKGQSVNTRRYERRRYGRLASISRALSRLGEKFYNFVFNNCEHFVTWCITGWHRSRQIEERATKLAEGALHTYGVYRISAVHLKDIEVSSPFGNLPAGRSPIVGRMAARVSRMMGKYAVQAIGKPTVREAHRVLTTGLKAVSKMAIAAASPLSEGFALAVAAYATLELFAAATGILVKSMPASVSDAIRGVVSKVCSTAKGFFGRAVSVVRSVGSRIWSGLGDMLGGCFKWASSFF